MTQNLLTKTLRWYIIFAIVILLITAPLFYIVTQRLYVDEANETLKLHKKEFIYYHLSGLKVGDIEDWNKHNRDEKILSRKHKLKHDKFTTIFQYDTLSHENEPYRVLMTPIKIEGKPYMFVAKINLVEREDLITSIAFLFLGLISAMLIGLYFITRVMSKKLWRPFYAALDHLEKFEVDKSVTSKLPSSSVSEFSRLNQAIDLLIQKNTAIYNNQKEFIENAAHELQTPLAVIQGKIEALFQQSQLTQSQSEVLEKLNESLTRLIRLNKNLLLLSRIEHDQFAESENISLNDLLKKNLEFFTEQAAAKNIRIEIKSEEQVRVKANQVLTEVLLNNLFLNSIRHNVSNGLVSLTLSKNNLTLSNTGVSALEQGIIFDRFSKTNPSGQGNGLGLAIVKKIADINGWRIQYSFREGMHSFSIDF